LCRISFAWYQGERERGNGVEKTLSRLKTFIYAFLDFSWQTWQYRLGNNGRHGDRRKRKGANRIGEKTAMVATPRTATPHVRRQRCNEEGTEESKTMRGCCHKGGLLPARRDTEKYLMQASMERGSAYRGILSNTPKEKGPFERGRRKKGGWKGGERGIEKKQVL